MALPRLIKNPNFVRYGVRVDTAPEWIWLSLFAAALWPAWWWMARRLTDGSDDPLGLLSIGVLTVLVWQQRHRLRPAPRLQWLATALMLTLAATLGAPWMPPLLSGLLAVLAMAAALAAWLPQRIPTLPVLGLCVLALPLLASLQFYAGYPLRVLTAEATRLLLSLVYAVERSGASLLVQGQLVIVDAPCSGVQMAWLAYFTACVVALHARRPNASFALRLPAVGAMVLVGNIVRNTVLVAYAGTGQALSGWAHEGVGLLAQALVCGAIVLLMKKETRHDLV